jgi:hypothetical protein
MRKRLLHLSFPSSGARFARGAAAVVLVAAAGLMTGRALNAHILSKSDKALLPLNVGDPPPSGGPRGVSGTVCGPDGEAIPRARVCASEVASIALDSPTMACGDADATGTFALDSLTPGRYRITGAADGHEPGRADPPAVDVNGGSCVGDVALVLQRGGASLRGVVLDARGGPVPGASVRTTVGAWPSLSVLEKSDASGHFHAATAAGPISLYVTAEGYAPTFTWTTAPAQDVTVRLTPSARATGKVLSEADGRALAGAVVRAIPVGNWGAPTCPTTLSADDGGFAFDALAPGTYAFIAEGNGWRGEAGTRSIGIAEQADGVVIGAWSVPAVEGTVSSLANTGCEGGTVSLGPLVPGSVSIDAPMSASPETRASNVPALVAPIGAAGHVRFRAVPPGLYRVSVRCHGEVLRAGPRAIEVGSGARVSAAWQVGPAGGIRVRVTDARDRPVPGAMFRMVWPTPAGVQSRTVMPLSADASGRFDQLGILFPGHYTVEATGGHEPASTAVEVGDSGTIDARLRLAGASYVTIRVRDARGSAVDDVVAGALAGDRVIQGIPLGEGRIRVGPLEGGAYDFQVFDGVNPPVSAAGAPGKTLVADDADLELPVTILRDATIHGRVVDPSGRAAGGVWVSAACGAANDSPFSLQQILFGLRLKDKRRVTSADGSFELSGLHPGVSCTVRAERPGGPTGLSRDVPSDARGVVVNLSAADAGG